MAGFRDATVGRAGDSEDAFAVLAAVDDAGLGED